MKINLPRAKRPKLLISCITISLVLFCIFFFMDLSGLTAFETILECHPQDVYITYFYKVIMSIAFPIGLYFTFEMEPEKLAGLDKQAELKAQFFAVFMFFGAIAILVGGVPVKDVDGLAVFSSFLFCNSFFGAFIVLTFWPLIMSSGIFLGAFALFRCFWLIKIKKVGRTK